MGLIGDINNNYSLDLKIKAMNGMRPGTFDHILYKNSNFRNDFTPGVWMQAANDSSKIPKVSI